jgi:MarR family transcriptional regulator, 2-MHQ and catechol-resistance regulon repressor
LTGLNDAGIWPVLRRASHWVERHALQSLSSLDIGLSDFAVLNTLLHRGPLPVNVIGAKVLLTSGSITAAVDRLARQGLVKRRKHPRDRRAALVHLTSKGEDFIRPSTVAHQQTMTDLISILSKNEQTELVRLLKKLGLHAMATLRPARTVAASRQFEIMKSRTKGERSSTTRRRKGKPA